MCVKNQISNKVSGPIVDCSGMAPGHIATAQVLVLHGKTMAPIKVCGNQQKPTRPRDRLQLFWNGPFDTWSGTEERSWRKNIFYIWVC